MLEPECTDVVQDLTCSVTDMAFLLDDVLDIVLSLIKCEDIVSLTEITMDDFCGDNVVGTYLSFIGYCFAIVGFILGGYLALYYSFRYRPAFMKLLQIKAQSEEGDEEVVEEVPEVHEEHIEDIDVNENGHDSHDDSRRVSEAAVEAREENGKGKQHNMDNGVYTGRSSHRGSAKTVHKTVELTTFETSAEEHVSLPKV